MFFKALKSERNPYQYVVLTEHYKGREVAFLRTQNIKRNDRGGIESGSASIVEVKYTGSSKGGSKGHSKQSIRERLGRPLYLSDDGKSGIFLSPVRGIVHYDVVTDQFSNIERDDPRIADAGLFHDPAVHVEFGDGYIFMKFMESTGLGAVLRGVFQKDADYQRCLTHIYHTVARNGERVRCDVMLERSFMQHLVPEVPLSCLKCDTRYFTIMGGDDVKMGFFKAYVAFMRKSFPGFGKACYVDSTPLPNDITDNPFDAFATHGTGSSENQMRMSMVLDSVTGMPVWFDFHPGNVLDLNTLKDVTDDLQNSLGITITEYVLDAGYASKELVTAFPALPEEGHDEDGTGIDDVRDIVVRMPARKGYPFKTLYNQCKPLMANGKYDFVRGRHAYFGVRRRVTVFDTEVYAYVYVDYDNALRGYRRFISEHPEEFESMRDRDKTWYRYKDGFFILMSSIPETPAEMLERYFGRTDIECVFKTSKEYLDILPLSKWTVETVRGKVLNDVISLIVYLGVRRAVSGSKYSVPEVFSRCRSLQCRMGSDGCLAVEAPNKHVKNIFAQFNLTVPVKVSIDEFPSCNGGCSA